MSDASSNAHPVVWLMIEYRKMRESRRWFDSDDQQLLKTNVKGWSWKEEEMEREVEESDQWSELEWGQLQYPVPTVDLPVNLKSSRTHSNVESLSD